MLEKNLLERRIFFDIIGVRFNYNNFYRSLSPFLAPKQKNILEPHLNSKPQSMKIFAQIEYRTSKNFTGRVFFIGRTFIILLILMSFNVQLEAGESSACLLEWINLERNQQGKQPNLFTFKQVLQQSFADQMLESLDRVFFIQFKNCQSNKKIEWIEKYLDQEFGKRMKWVLKKSLGDLSSEDQIRQFIKLVCYFSIHSKNKNQIINRILTLSEETQKFLMEHMQVIQQKLENIMQIKQILEQLELLQCENEQYKKALQQMAKANSQLLEIVKDYEEENKKSKDEVEKLRKQKCQVFSALKIDYITEYLDAFNKVKQQNQRYLDIIRQEEQKVEGLQIHNKELNDRIRCDCVVINNLSEQIARLKQIYNESLVKYDYDSHKSNSKNNNILKSGGKSNNKQNISKCSTLGKSVDMPADWLSLLLQEDQSQEKSLFKSYNNELMGKLQGMYSKYNKLNEQTAELRQQNKQVKKRNSQLKGKIRSVQHLQSSFQIRYQAADNEARKALKCLIRTTK